MTNGLDLRPPTVQRIDVTADRGAREGNAQPPDPEELGRRQGPGVQPLPERRSVQALHDEEWPAVVSSHVVEDADARVAQSRSRTEGRECGPYIQCGTGGGALYCAGTPPWGFSVALLEGTQLGPYEVIAPLGAGGMGEVYRARDTRLRREVAIKVLPPELVADEERRRRFLQEARAASALNHPNIVTIHEIETVGGVDFIVMEYVAGQTLDAVIPKQGMPWSEALRVAIPIADALSAAHEKGIVHRDLKPANVALTREGVVKVLDFGLAKLLWQDVEDTGETQTTLSAARTGAGAIAGTAAYMSPEQATGGKLDARTDIFSFGALLYEMVTGRKAFGGRTVSDTLQAVVRDQPPAPRERVPAIPEPLERLILLCLRKEPDRRFQHMSDVKVQLLEVKEAAESRSVAPVAPPAAGRRPWLRRAAWAGTAILLIAVAVAAVWRLWPRELPAPTVVQLTSERNAGAGSFSPDGTQVVYHSLGETGDNWDLWLKIVGQAEARRLTTDPAADRFPAWSPDGTQIAFTRSGVRATPVLVGTIHLISPMGGAARRLCELPALPGLSWSPDGRWLAAALLADGPPARIHLVSTASGEAHALTSSKPGEFNIAPSFSPDGRALAYATCLRGGADMTLVRCTLNVLSLDSDLRPQGPARAVTQPLLGMTGTTWTGDGASVVYATADYLWRVRADGSGSPERLELAGRNALMPSVSKAGTRLSFVRANQEMDIYRLPFGGSPSPLLASAFADVFPKHSPDGKRIAFQSGRAGGGYQDQAIWLAEVDGSNATRLTRGPGVLQGSPSWSPDGQWVAFDAGSEIGQMAIWVIRTDGSGLRQVTRDPGRAVVPSWSRDGRFIYFASNRTGRLEVWRVAAEGGTEEQITSEGGACPVESPDGRTLYYQAAERGALLARPISGGRPRTVLPCVPTLESWAVGPRGIVHVQCGPPDAGRDAVREQTLRYLHLATGKDEPLATVEGDWIGGVSVSPDGKTILYGRSVSSSNLMMIDNFR
jgi:Tol biopolymer transport system component/serine/threonine protein kinase